VPELIATIRTVSPVGVALLISAFFLGLRHGIDWDHIAAISDITSTQETVRSSLWFSTLYAIGHAAVVLAIGAALIVADFEMPAGLESLMGRVVGATLVVLGVWVLVALVRHGDRFRMRSRWMLLFSGVRSGIRRLRGHRPGPEASDQDPFATYGAKTSLGVGMLHGVGAETPTQVVIFLGATGVGGKGLGMGVLVVFVVGLIVANTLIAVGASVGFLGATRSRWAYRLTGGVIALFSLVLGTIFLLGGASMLPTLAG